MTEGFSNYFNYFTEIEEHFQQARGTALFLLSPLDWALIEAWKNAGIPLAAVLRGIDVAFEKWRAKRSRAQQVNSLAFCAQAVMLETQRMADAGSLAAPKPHTEPEPPFSDEALRAFLSGNAAALRATGVPEYSSVADSLDRIAAELPEKAVDLESLEQRLSMLEHRLIALARTRQTEEQALAARQQLETYLKPYRAKMTAPQIAMLENQFLERSTLEYATLPRLSLFYLSANN